MKKLFMIGVTMLCLGASATEATKTIKLRVVETSDVHGHFFPYDFINQKPLNGTLTRVSSYVNRLRQDYGERLLLLDNGDILQGQPISYWSNYVDSDRMNVAAQVINYMKYDAETFGNHDVETGHKVYDQWVKDVECPMLGANIIDNQTGQPYVKPYTILTRDSVRIAIIGLLTPAIPNWLPESLWEGLHFQEMVSSARQWVKHVKEVEHADLVFGLFHSGKDGGIVTPDYEEDASLRVATEVPGFDIIFFGHDHTVHNDWVTNSAGEQVLCLDPSCFAQRIADASIELTFTDGRLTGKKIDGQIVSMADEAIDEQMMHHFQPVIDEVKAYANRQIGVFETTISTRDCFFGSSAFTDFVHNLQLQITGADISFNAPLTFDTAIKQGPVLMSDMFKLYRYENAVYVLRLKGEEIRRHLEMSYDLWVNTMKSPDDHIMLLSERTLGDQQRTGFKNMTFNFDSAAGIDYEVDVTKPDGEKVRILRMSNGEPFDEAKWYRVVMNSYRGNGGGELLTRGAGLSKEEIQNRIIYRSELDQRHYLTKEIERMGSVRPQPNGNWRFVPDEWAKPALARDRKLIFRE